MDEDVLAAMAKWPNVPDAYGWLSLSLRGEWRLHANGDTQRPGEPVENQKIQRFISRNYSSDSAGRWFFQNGPQRVFVQLEAAPFILHTTTAFKHSSSDGAPPDQGLALCTHTGLDVSVIKAWWLDNAGHLYAQTEHGAGLIAGRDLPSVLDALITDDGAALGTALEDILQHPPVVSDSPALWVRFRPQNPASPPDLSSMPFNICSSSDIPTRLGFNHNPGPPAP